MIFHSNINSFTEATNKLIFSNKNELSRHSQEDASGVDVKTTIVCNDLGLGEFETNLTKITNSISKSIKSKVDQLGKDYYNEIIETIISLDKLKDSLFQGSNYIGSTKNLDNTVQKSEAYKIGAIEIREFEQSKYNEEDYYKIVFSTITRLKSELLNLSKSSLNFKSKSEKLTWNTKPSELAELLRDLEAKGWITPPKFNTETSYKGLGKLCANIFSFEGTERSLTNSLQTPTLDKFKCDLIDLPYLHKLS